MSETRARVEVIACTPAKAQAFVERMHRHHGPVPPGYALFALVACTDRRACGVAILGRPTNRNSDDGHTIEVLRIATDGTPNACSALLGAAARVAKTSGYARVITYTLDTESGASLRGAGWDMEAGGIKSFWASSQTKGRTVKPRDHYTSAKVRWAKTFRVKGAAIEWPQAPDLGPLPLFGGGAQ